MRIRIDMPSAGGEKPHRIRLWVPNLCMNVLRWRWVYRMLPTGQAVPEPETLERLGTVLRALPKEMESIPLVEVDTHDGTRIRITL